MGFLEEREAGSTQDLLQVMAENVPQLYSWIGNNICYSGGGVFLEIFTPDFSITHNVDTQKTVDNEDDI